MNDDPSTCWTLVRGADDGDTVKADELVRRYAPLVLSNLRGRWQRTAISGNLDDACQDVFF